MKGQKFIKKIKDYTFGSMRRSWVVSYLIILLLPLALNAVVYRNAYTTIKHQARESQKSAVERLSTNMDNEFKRIEEFVSVLSYDINMNYLLNASGLDSFKQSYATASRLYDLNESLLLNLPSSSFISDFYIFSPKNSLVFHNSGVNEISRYGELPGNYAKLLYETCQSLDTKSVQLFSVAPEQGTSCMAVLYPLPYSYLPKGYMVILMDSEELNRTMLSLYSQENSQIYLVDENYSMLTGSDPLSETDAFSHYDFSNDSVRGRLPHTDDTLLMRSASSGILPLHYICTLPESVATANLIYMRHSLWISAFFCLAGGGFLIILLSRYNYSPWQKLMTTIEELSKSSVQNGTNEFQIVLNTLTSIYQEKATIEEVFHRQNRTVYSYYLTRLLKGRMGIEELEETVLENMEQQLQLANYTVLISLADVKDNWTSSHTELVTDAYLSFFETQIAQKLQDALGASFSIGFAEVYDYTACIIGMTPEEADTWQVQLSSAMEMIASDLSENLDVQYYFAFSSLHHSITEMYTAWEEAFSSISLSVMNQEKALTFYEDVDFSDPGSYAYPQKMEQTLINFIQIGQNEEAAELIRSLSDEIAKQFPVFETAKCTASDVLCSVTKAFTHLPDSAREQLQNQYYGIVESFMQANSYKKLQKKLLEAASLVASGYSSAVDTDSPQSTWIPRIDQELEANLCDENLNVMFLAHRLGVSSKYISSLYLEAKGVSIVDTIHRRRIEKFKELICAKDMNIADAAAAVGYNSIATLNRWVKKYEGVTPGQLKSIRKNSSYD